MVVDQSAKELLQVSAAPSRLSEGADAANNCHVIEDIGMAEGDTYLSADDYNRLSDELDLTHEGPIEIRVPAREEAGTSADCCTYWSAAMIA